MSIKIMALVWECEFEKLYYQMVLLAMADHANDQGESVFPSVARLAWKVGCSERHVQTAISHLRKMSILVKVAEPRYHRPTEYKIDMSRAKRKASFVTAGVNSSSPIKATGVNSGSHRGELGFTTGVNSGSQEPSLNHQEPSGGEKPSQVYRRITEQRPRRAHADVMDMEVTDKSLWFQCVYEWIMRGYNDRNVKGMLDWYKAGGPPNAGPGARAEREAEAIQEEATELERRKVQAWEAANL